ITVAAGVTPFSTLEIHAHETFINDGGAVDWTENRTLNYSEIFGPDRRAVWVYRPTKEQSGTVTFAIVAIDPTNPNKSVAGGVSKMPAAFSPGSTVRNI